MFEETDLRTDRTMLCWCFQTTLLCGLTLSGALLDFLQMSAVATCLRFDYCSDHCSDFYSNGIENNALLMVSAGTQYISVCHLCCVPTAGCYARSVGSRIPQGMYLKTQTSQLSLASSLS